MLAHHPKTGKPIRILRSEASVWRSEKTLVWLRDQDKTIAWGRWDTLVVGLDAATTWQDKRLDFLVLTASGEKERDWFLRGGCDKYKMVFLTLDLVKRIGEATFRKMAVPNVLVLDEMHRLYPFLGQAWLGTEEDAVCMVATTLRYVKVVGTAALSERLSELQGKGFSLTCDDTAQPKKLWLITQYYKPTKARREREIRLCLEKNVQLDVIDKILLLNETDYTSSFPAIVTAAVKSGKVEQHVINERLTYRKVIEWIQKNVPTDVICVFANADIYLDAASWPILWSVNMTDIFMALLRWDVPADISGGEEPKIFGPRNDSQDTWVVLSDSVKNKTWDWTSLDFPFGQGGCDNAITVECLRKKFLVVNPAMTLKTFHVHNSAIRNYDAADIVEKPAYLYVDPTGIHDMQPVLDLGSQGQIVKDVVAIERKLQSAQPKALETFCKMLERGERYTWKANEDNKMEPSQIPFLTYKNSFQAPQGLMYGYNKLFIGKSETAREAWAQAQLSPISPCYSVKKCLVAPWRSQEVSSREGYILYYVSKILWMTDLVGLGDFWAKNKESAEDLQIFRWPTQTVPLLPHNESVQVFCEEAVQYPYLPINEIRREEIEALRNKARAWKEFIATDRKWVVMIDGRFITMDMVRQWEKDFSDRDWQVIFEDRTSVDRMMEKLSGAEGFVAYGGPKAVSRWGPSWMLPRGAKVIEIQNEMDPSGEAAHVSGAAELQHIFCFVPRAKDEATRGLIDKQVRRVLEGGVKEAASLKEGIPIIRMPRSSLTGFFAHAGDSFREMVRLWAKKGYVQIVEDDAATHVWLGSVGDVLLYDRPTLDWLMAAPPKEQTWKKALFGNPKASTTGGPATSWFFWPRRPELVEKIVEEGSVTKAYADRTKTLVFYGRIENKVQERRRTQMDWAAVCDGWSMPKGNESYPFTQEEYLRLLADAKFGLCLAGYGKKCHREVECMAMGCVPIVAADVDMENYADPPQEGLHYVRVSTPEEAKAATAAISEAKWQVMSDACRLWWSQNASAEGSWRLTERLSIL